MDFQIRPVCSRDAAGINELRRMPGVFENTLGIPSERLQRNEDHIAHLDDNSYQFVAITKTEEQEKLIGMCGMHVFANARLRHSASLGIMVHREYQGKGVGSRLLESVLDIADNWLMLVRVELGVFADNERAISLYQKYGFEVEGKKRMAAIRNGRYVDELMMARIRVPGSCD